MDNRVEEIYSAWELTTPPVRPSDYEISYLRHRLGSVDGGASVLILGMTPELIDLCVEVGVGKIVVIELRKFAYLSLKKFAKQNWDRVEFVFSDWRIDNKSFHNRFEYIIGHGTFLLLSYTNDWQVVIGIMYRYLKSSGVFVVRHYLKPIDRFDWGVFKGKVIDDLPTDVEDSFGQLAEIARLLTLLRCGAILNSTRHDGNVIHNKLRASTEEVFNLLENKLKYSRYWEIVKREFNKPTASGYENMLPLAVPYACDVLPLYTNESFMAFYDEIPDSDLPGVLSFILAVKKGG